MTTTTHEQLVRDRITQLLDTFDPATTPAQEIWGAQFDAGLAWVRFPEGQGGLGLSSKLQRIVDDELRAAGVPSNFPVNPIGIGMGAPTIQTYAPEPLKAAWLRPLFTCEDVWCQLFSEPGAGSDVASLSTRAVRDGDEWVVNGQKVWTTLAHLARWGLLVTRTNPDQPKHKGMTYFVVDMHAPGVEVRPLKQMTGDCEFNEVYFTDARIPDTHRLGDVGDGWRVALTTLMNERVAISGRSVPRGGGAIAVATRHWDGRADPVMRDRLMKLWVDAEVLRLTQIRAAQLQAVGNPGPEGSIAKLFSSELQKRIGELAMNLLGPRGMLGPGDYSTEPADQAVASIRYFLRARANTIEGGTSEIMRNILGERVLGLPGEPRVDKDLPWSDVPRS